MAMSRRSGILRAKLAAVALVALSFVSAPAEAHGRLTSAGPADGITIPYLTHGQMAVIADYRGDILDLAARQIQTDATFRRMMNYANIQFSFCMWGLVPASITDDASPFNECSHAYLAATRAVLMRMRDRPDHHPAVDALVSRIDIDMVRKHASLVLCRYSNETFTTAEVIRPSWREVLFHPPSLATFAGFALVLTGGAAAAARATRPACHPRPDCRAKRAFPNRVATSCDTTRRQ